MIVELSKRVVWAMGVVWLVVVCSAIGYAVSPHTIDGRPVLLSPEVRAIETYRRSVMAWVHEWNGLAQHLNSILSSEGELLAISQETQQVFAYSVELAKTVEASNPPTSMVGLGDHTAMTAQAFVKASLSAAQFVSAPSAEYKSNAEIALKTAKQQLATLETNQWINQSK